LAIAKQNSRLKLLQSLVLLLLIALTLKVVYGIVAEYRSYFPADFNSAFLGGRRPHFKGLYRVAFYAHIIVGPWTLLVGMALMFSGFKRRFQLAHRLAGRSQIALILLVLTPSGLVMSTQAFTGAFAGWGFAMLSVSTGATAIVAVHFARKRKFVLHQLWATRCFILLWSPILLRLLTGVAFVTNVESPVTYQATAWLSWLLPITIFEIWRLVKTNRATTNRKSTVTR